MGSAKIVGLMMNYNYSAPTKEEGIRLLPAGIPGLSKLIPDQALTLADKDGAVLESDDS